VRGPFEASEFTVRLPFDVPEAVGENSTLKVALWPAANVAPELIPARLNPAPEILALEIETLELPVLVTVPESVCFLPIVTLPKLIALRFEPNIPDRA
jgi:hypothetical protein